MTPEQKYINTVSLEHRKKYAQFFTPEDIATFMCKWVMNGKHITKVLEPAYGLGIFSRIINKSKTTPIDAYEIDSKIFSYAASECPNGVNLCNEDYFKSKWDSKYDAIICNPPYLKFHDYDNVNYISDVNKHLKTRLSGFTNLYSLFLLKSIAQLQDNGRLAYIIPSEFLNADYGVEVKRELLKSNTLKHIIIIDFTKCAFENAITTACIILCEKTDSPTVRFSTLTNINNLNDCLHKYVEYNIKELEIETKWKKYYEKNNSTKYNNLVPFSNFARVSRGIATGANNYFTFNQSKIDYFNIPKECLLPCICKAVDAQKIFFTLNDFNALVNKNKPVYLFNGCINNNNSYVNKYIIYGEQIGIDKRYLTSSRSPWYSIENRSPAPILVSVFNRNGLRFIKNEANVYNLTTFHCVYPKNGINIEVLFAYLITDVAKNIFLSNSRQYGNGLVKFEPNDLNKGMVVDLSILTTEETNFIKKVYHYIKDSQNIKSGITLLNNFFENRYSKGIIELKKLNEELYLLKKDFSLPPITYKKTNRIKQRIKQLNFLDLFNKYSDNNIIDNSSVCEEIQSYKLKQECPQIDFKQNVLISLVTESNKNIYNNHSAKIYRTGKRFPATISLNKLYYFIPYIKKKGIRDIYLIKNARLGIRKEGQMDEDKNDIRLVFEIEFIKQIFDEYKPIELRIWHTFTDTKLIDIIK